MQMRVAIENSVPEGDLALPESIREKAGLRAGDLLDVEFEMNEGANRIVLTFPKQHKPEGRIIADPLTGWPVLDFGPDAPELTNEQVLEMLADFQ